MISNCTSPNRENQFVAGFQKPSLDKIKKVAIEVLKGLAVVLAGAALGALTLATAGTIWLIVGVAVGAAAGGIAYGSMKGFMHKVKQKGYPELSHRTKAPKPLEYWSKKKQDQALSTYFEQELINDPLYQKWKTLKKIKSDSSAKRHLRRRMRQKGLCAGESIALAKERFGSSKDERIKVKAVEVFKIQIAECMRADFEGNNQTSDADEAFNMRQRGLQNAQPQVLDLQNISQQIPAGEAYGFIRLESAKKAHFVYFECIGPSGRFYDSANQHTGWHENYNTRDELIASLQNHLQAGLHGKKIYRSQFNRGLLYAYKK